MEFKNIQEWLARRLSIADDVGVAAGGTDIDKLIKDTQARTVTPAVLSESPSEIGRVLRYIREKNGWSQRDLADMATIDIDELRNIEILANYELKPRTLMNLADVCGFSRRRFQLLARHVIPKQYEYASTSTLKFAARSNNIGCISSEEFDAIRILIETLSNKEADEI